MEHPLASVRPTLVPDSLVNVKVFEADSPDGVEAKINAWVVETQNLVVCPGPVHWTGSVATVALTYVEARSNDDPERRQMVEAPKPDAKPRSRSSRIESDGS